MNSHTHQHQRLSQFQDTSQTGQQRLIIVFFLTLSFFLVEVIGGILSNSLALLADAGHMLQDLVALGLAVFALWFAQKPKNQRHTFGYKRAEVLAAFVNGLSLVVVSAYILLEAYHRINSVFEIETGLMLGVAIVGLVINIFGLGLLYRSSEENLNTKGAFLHVLSDTLGSIGAIGAAILIIITKLVIFDLLVSIFITILILLSSLRLLRESIHILMEGNPFNFDLDTIENVLTRFDGIVGIHDTHLWALSSSQVNFSCHIIIKNNIDPCPLLDSINALLKKEYQIHHATIQMEHENAMENCGSC